MYTVFGVGSTGHSTPSKTRNGTFGKINFLFSVPNKKNEIGPFGFALKVLKQVLKTHPSVENVSCPRISRSWQPSWPPRSWGSSVIWLEED